MDNEIRELLHEMADEAPRQDRVPPGLKGRARRRIGLTVSGSLAVAGLLALGVVVGVRALPEIRPTPAEQPTSPAPLEGQSRRLGFTQGWSVTLTLPSDWRVESRGNEHTLLTRPTNRPSEAIVVGSEAAVPCDPVERPVVQSTADEIAQAILANPDLQTSAPVPVMVGGLEGVRIDAATAPGVVGRGGPAVGEPELCLVALHEYASGWHAWSVNEESRARIYLMDVPEDSADEDEVRTIVILVVARNQYYDQILAEAEAIIGSFEFKVE